MHEFSSCCPYGSFTGCTHFLAPEITLFAFWDYLSFLVLVPSHPLPSATLPCPPWLRDTFFISIFFISFISLFHFSVLALRLALLPRDTVSSPSNRSNVELPCILQAQLKCLVPPFTSFLSLSYISS